MSNAAVDRGHPPLYKIMKARHAISSIQSRRLKVSRISEVNDPFEYFALNSMKPAARRLIRTFKQTHDKTFGLLCFSERWKNPLLWSHYGDCHKGICLGFDVDPTLGERGVQKVEYSPDKLMLDDEHPVGSGNSAASIPEILAG